MEQELFDVLSVLEIQAEKERMQQGATEIMDFDSAKYVSLLAISQGAKRIVEVGSGVGYSPLWLAYAASVTGGKVMTCEKDPVKADETRANVEKAGLLDYVEVLTGDAREVNDEITPIHRQNPARRLRLVHDPHNTTANARETEHLSHAVLLQLSRSNVRDLTNIRSPRAREDQRRSSRAFTTSWFAHDTTPFSRVGIAGVARLTPAKSSGR